jgi:HEAT repeat protein
MIIRHRRGIIACMGLLMSMSRLGHAQETSSVSLVEQFKNEKVFWRQLTVAQELVRVRNRRVLPALAGWLDHWDRHVRGNTAFVFAGLGDRRGFEVISAIIHDLSDRPQGQGMSGVAGNAAGNGWGGLAQIRADRYYAIHLLGELRDPRAVPILVPLLQDELNYKVAWALGHIGDRRAIHPLIETLRHEEALVRISAIQALVVLRAKEAVPHLRGLLDDTRLPSAGDQVSVADTAKAAIAKLERA